MILIYGSREDHWYAFIDALRYHGFEVDFVDAVDPVLYKDEDIWISQFYKLYKHIKDKNLHLIHLPKKFIMFCLNSIKDMDESSIARQRLLDAKCGAWSDASLVWSFDQNEIHYYNKYLNVPYEKFHAIVFGYSPFYETYFPPAINMPKIYDILFFGAYSNKRAEDIKYLRDLGLHVKWCGEDPVNSPTEYDQVRSDYIACSTISIHIHKFDPLLMGNVFTRLSYLITHKVFLISEANPSSIEMEDLKTVIPMFSGKKEMGELCLKWLLASCQERQNVAHQAYSFLKTKYHLYDRIPVKELRELYLR